MVKKKSPVLGIGTIGLGVIIAVVVALYITTGFPEQFITFGDAQGLLDDINNAPDSFQLPIDCIIVSECDGEFVDPPPPITDIIYDCDTIPIPETELFLQECPNIVLDPIDNKTKFVGDDGTVQDPIIPPPEPVSPPEPEPELFDVTISSKIFKTDNNGTLTESKTNFAIPILAFFVEDTSNIDFDKGFIQQELIVNAPPNTEINLDANFDVLIANQTILPEPLTISISGITDVNGELAIDYVNPLGLKSKDFLFDFKDHIDKFPITGTEKVEFVLNNVNVTSGNFEYALDSIVIYSLTIATDPNKIIIIDETGGRTRIFPTDDTISAYSTPSTFYVARNCVPRRICSPAYTACCYRAPAMGAGQFTHIMPDGTEEVLAEWNSNGLGGVRFVFKQAPKYDSFAKFSDIIQRDQIYRFDIGSPTPASITFKTPIERTSYIFYCKGTSATAGTGLGYCNFQQASFKQALADTLVTP